MKHQVTLDFETTAVEGKLELNTTSVYVQIHFKMNKRFYKPIWKYALLNDQYFTRYLVEQLHAFVENRWGEIVRASQTNTPQTHYRPPSVPWAIFVQSGKNFYVSCSFPGPIPLTDPAPDLNTFLNIPIRGV